MTSAYKILFTVTLRHDYYSNKACNDFTIRPTADCAVLLDQHHLMCRQSGNKLIIFTPAEDGKPLFDIQPGIVFRFYLFCENVYFTHFTNWDQEDHHTKKFYTGNQNNNISDNNCYITKSLTAYNNKTVYHQGNLVINAQGEVHESLQENPTDADSKPLTDKNFWRKHAGNRTQYCTTNDLIEFSQNLLPVVMIPGAKIKVDVFDNTKNDFKKNLLTHTVGEGDEMSETLRLFSGLTPGRYKLTVNTFSREIYYDPDMQFKKAWGIIEIHHQADLPKGMQILDAGKLPVDKNDPTKLTPRNFIIHFRNRSVLWKYKLRLMKDNYSIADSSPDKYSFEKKESSFISKEPIPLSEEPIKTFGLKKDSTALIDVLKNPAFQKLALIEKPDPFDPQNKKMNKYLCSEIFLTI